MKAVEHCGYSLSSVPYLYKNKKLCSVAVSESGRALAFVPKRLRTYEMCLTAVQGDAEAYAHVPENVKSLIAEPTDHSDHHPRWYEEADFISELTGFFAAEFNRQSDHILEETDAFSM